MIPFTERLMIIAIECARRCELGVSQESERAE